MRLTQIPSPWGVREGERDLLPDGHVLLICQALSQAIAGVTGSDPAKGPGGVAAHQRVCFVGERDEQRRHGRRIGQIAERHRDVTA